MALNRENTRFFHEALYNGQLESCTLLKRRDGQDAGQFAVHRLYNVRMGAIQRAGEIIQTDETARDTRTIHVPRVELNRVGVHYLNPADRFVDAENRWWEPEAPTGMKVKLFQNHICVNCVRIDPVPNVILPVKLGSSAGSIC